jgi:hypothetical protein
MKDQEMLSNVILEKVKYNLTRIFSEETIINNYYAQAYLDRVTNDMILSIDRNVYESSTTKEEVKEDKPEKITVTEWKDIYDSQPASPLEHIKYGLYKFIPYDSFFPTFFPVKYKLFYVDKVAYNTEIINQRIVKKITNIKNVYPDMVCDSKQKTLSTYDWRSDNV